MRSHLATVRLLLALVCGSACLTPLQATLPSSGNLALSNLVAWCIVPFDSQKRGPEERAALLETLGIRRLAYDWRAEHIPTFDAEVVALRKRNIDLFAWWFPAALNDEARAILACIERHRIHPQLWITLGTEPEPEPARLQAKIRQTADSLAPLCEAAARLGCTVGLYNHLGWFGEPANQVAVLELLRAAGHTNAGCVYNFHHGHAHIDTFASHFKTLQPHLIALNLNGMVWNGDQTGKKIIPLGTGDEELNLLRIVHASGWKGPVGVIGHTDEDAGLKLRKELDGLARLAPLATDPPQPPRPRPAPTPAPTPPAAPLLPSPATATVPGRFNSALDARVEGLLLDGLPGFRSPPLTVEAWVRLADPSSFNIIAASEAKSSPTHWELYSYAGSGELSLYSPGSTPAEIRSGVPLCDGQWHHVAAHIAPDQVRLFIDGRPVVTQAVRRASLPDTSPARFAIGRLVEGGLGCNGWIDEVRISRGLRPINGLPSSPVHADESSLAHWNLDSFPTPAAITAPAVGGLRNPPAPARALGEPASSGREPGTQGEADWVDNRWQATDLGPFFASNLRLFDGSTLAKGLTVRVGTGSVPAAVAYDTAHGSLRAAWTGGFIRFDPARFGLIGTPAPQGTEAFSSGRDPAPNWPGHTYRFAGIHNGVGGVVLEHRVDGVRILELPGLHSSPAGEIFTRTFHIDPHPKPILLRSAAHLRGSNLGIESINTVTNGVRTQLQFAGAQDGSVASATAISGSNVESVESSNASDGGSITVRIPANPQPQILTVHLWRGPASREAAFRSHHQQTPPATNPLHAIRPIPVAPAPVITRGQRGADSDFLAVDTLTMPYDNPAKALLFAAGVDVTPDGAVFVCTIHGDVWKVTGVDDSLGELRWHRFATGLFQPLGLKVRNGQVFVLGRDRITRLHDHNGDGRADFLESFHDGIRTSTGGHDYVTSLEKDDAGNFYYVDPVGVHRVAADGSTSKTLATGFRNPNGMGVRPDGAVITVAPQQGEWTPSSGIWQARRDLYGGYGGPKPGPGRAEGYDAPLLWLPHAVDNSSGSQVWVPEDRWGPLGGQMLHLLWGRCGMLLVLPDGAHPTFPQAAAVSLPVRFLSGPNRGSFDPRSGHLYVAGSTGWQTSAVKDGAVQRVRFTGKPVTVPIAWAVRTNAVEIEFAVPLDPATATDPGSYDLKAWNYRYARQYGSKDWSVEDPKREGRDMWTITGAKILSGNTRVLLQVPGLRPAMQGELKYNLDRPDGARPLRGSLWFSIGQNPSKK